ncbi:unnamed protein product [Pedinophyceae sp. YPF-701]|nr:unnamed protein product [Pedinophyceae sp. YPF-701]
MFHRPSVPRPENALKRAQELLAVDQKESALKVLHDVLTNRRHNRTWQKALEDIMRKHVELCVELKRGRLAKEGLMQYRNVCQHDNVRSLEEIIKHLLDLASAKAAEAQTQAEIALADIEDLEQDATPEDLTLSYVTGDQSKDRTDRELVAPWFKFLWETYRSILEILRNNARLESLYAMTSHRALAFCLKYQRATEFRRLCDILRNHLKNLHDPQQRQRDRIDRPDLTQAESLQRYLDTRFEQLRVAAELSMWQEAFRSIEDIYSLIETGTRAGRQRPQPRMMGVYYMRLTQIFTMSDSPLYLAFAWYKLFSLLVSSIESLPQADKTALAAAMVCSALAVAPYDKRLETSGPDVTQDRDRMLRMANLLGVAVDSKDAVHRTLSRATLVNAIAAKNLLSIVPKEIADIFALLEGPFMPLDICKRLQPLIERLPALQWDLSDACPMPKVELGPFCQPLKEAAVLRMLSQLQRVYSVVKISTLDAMVPFMEFRELERVVVDASRAGHLTCRVDHRRGVVEFRSAIRHIDDVNGFVQTLARGLQTASKMIWPEPKPELEEARRRAVAEYRERAEMTNNLMNARKMLVEKRKEETERMAAEQEREAEARRLEQEAAEREAEAKRLAQERARREQEKILAELEAKEQEEARQLAAERGIKVRGGERLDKDEIVREVMREKQEKLQDFMKKIARMETTIDHLERARRDFEREKIVAHYRERHSRNAEAFKAEQEAFLANHRKAWEIDLQHKRRLARIEGDAEQLKADIMQRREAEFEALRRKRQAVLQERRAARKEEIVMQRKLRYLEQLRREAREEMAAKQRAEEERRRKEEEERASAAAAAAPPAGAGGYRPPGARGAAPGSAGGGGYVPPSKRGAVGMGGPPGRRRRLAAADAADRWGPPGGRGTGRRHPRAAAGTCRRRAGWAGAAAGPGGRARAGCAAGARGGRAAAAAPGRGEVCAPSPAARPGRGRRRRRGRVVGRHGALVPAGG